jgi:anti-sigma B factor antagonist
MQEMNEIKITELKPGIASIVLGENIQGGKEALDFASKLFEISEKNYKCLVINLHEVKMMNSSGLGMLVSALNTLKKNEIKMVLTNIPDKIDNLLKMTHLNQVFTSFSTVEEAIKDIE